MIEEPESLPEVWQPPPEDECQKPQVYDSPLVEPDDILRFRMVFDLHDNLVDFAIILMTGPGEAKYEVARADIRHTGLHVHWFRESGTQLRRQELMPVRTLAEVQEGYIEALDGMMDNWEEYKRRWHRG